MSARAAVGAVLAILSGACGAAEWDRPCTRPQVTDLVVTASPRVNMSDDGHSLPTRVRVYQLTDIHALERASFDQLWSAPARTLGDALVDEVQVTALPNQRLRRPFRTKNEARFVAAVGGVRTPYGRRWRAAAPLPSAPTKARCGASSKQAANEWVATIRLDGSRVRARVSAAHAGRALGAGKGTKP